MLYHLYMKSIYSTQLHISIAVLCIGLFLPISASAEYSFHGRTFDTQAEMQAYASSYLSVWKELHGYDTSTTEISHHRFNLDGSMAFAIDLTLPEVAQDIKNQYRYFETFD